MRHNADSDEETSRKKYDWPFANIAGKYDNSPFIIGVAENTYVANLDDGSIQNEFSHNTINSTANDYNKLSEDGSVLMTRIRNSMGGGLVRFINLNTQETLVEAFGSTLYTDLSTDGKYAMIYLRQPNEDAKISVSIGQTIFNLPIEPGSRFKLVKMDLETGEYTETPYTNRPSSIRDMEFSTDGKILYYQEGSSIDAMNLETWESQLVPARLNSRPSYPIKILKADESDFLLFRSGQSKTLINIEPVQLRGFLDSQESQLVLSENGRYGLAISNGVATKLEFREGHFVQGRLNRRKLSSPWILDIDSKDRAFYVFQESLNLSEWTWIEHSATGNGDLLQTIISYANSPDRLFFRAMEFAP